MAHDIALGGAWSALEDRDLVAILRGKLAGVRGEDAALANEDAGLKARHEEIFLQRLALEVRERALLNAIAAFVPKQSDNEEGTTDGHEGAAEAA